MSNEVQYWGEFVKLNTTGEIVRLLAYDEFGAGVEIDGIVVTVWRHQISRLNSEELYQIQCLKLHAKVVTREKSKEELAVLRHIEFEKLVAANDSNRESMKKIWQNYEDLEAAIEPARARREERQQKRQPKF